MTAGELTDRVLAEFCADLRSVWQRAGGPGLRALGTRTLLSKSQVGAILAGRIRRPPDWDVVRSLVGCFREYAERHASTSSLAPGAATEEYWRSRYTVIEQAFRHGREHDRALDREHDREHGREVTVRRPTHPRHRAASPVPRQLPSTVGTFVGRVDELATLTGLPATTTLVVIDGMAGIGKTTLALTWARRAADRFPDGQLYLNLRGFDPDRPATDPTEALHDVVCALGVPPDRIPTTVDGRAALFRSLLAGRRTLLILDNARDSEQVRPLLPGAPGCLTVVTSRNGLAGLVAVDDARPMTLGPLSGAEASTLLAGRIGTGRVAAEPAMADRVVAACAALPLALAVAAAHAATRPNLTLADLAAELTSELTSELTTDVLDPGDLDPGDPRSDLWAVFSWSYRSLAPDAARLFRLLTLYPGHDVGVAAAASLAGTPIAATRRILAALRDANMVVEVSVGRFAMHDLLRAYGTALVDRAERHDALGRLLDHLLHTAAAARGVLYPGRDRADLPPARPGTAVGAARGVDAARAWFTRERAALTAAVRIAAGDGLDPYAWRLAWIAAEFLQRGGHWRDWRDTAEIGLSAAHRHGARAAQALLHRHLGHAWSLLDDPDRARTHLTRALDLYVRLDDPTGRAATHRTLGSLLVRLDRVEDALEEDRHALRLFRAADDLGGQALTLNNTAWKHVRLGRHDDAMAIGRQALALYRTARHRSAGSLYGEADTWDTVGCVHHHRGEYRAAIDCYRRALDLFRSRGDRYHEADTLTRLGDSLLAAGDPDGAGQARREATTILVQLSQVRRPG
ncbi:hypothetical protein Vau01_041470 [Virgisporangium aurantiacum]|uniref:NB-ARC domain-containing protein n=1 Tax=Virgisporangium aurantiacum TaxID=175570 RepID=A0A8J3Z7G1_9ACTN|nr:hypothetical protein Vau01_041470 [Virgisporangium aurantiacum]